MPKCLFYWVRDLPCTLSQQWGKHTDTHTNINVYIHNNHTESHNKTWCQNRCLLWMALASSNTVRSLGVNFDCPSVCIWNTVFFHVCNILKLKTSWCWKTSSCTSNNSLLSCTPKSSLKSLQFDLKNAAARVLTGSRERDYISPILAPC